MNLLSRSTIRALEPSSTAFRRRDPFRHVVIEDFFESSFATELLAQFPAFERGNARNEAGELAGKAVVERIRDLGPAYRALDDLVQSPAFLDWLSSVTGIPDLLYDPHYFGGGSHENRHGQALDAHVDFNRHPVEPWHRRLNLIVYLNPEWQESWGGALQLHSDPRAPDNRTHSIVPAFNRCVIFETTEWSWHGFPPISLPAAHADRSRRSIALYFYTTSRPAEELANPHSTVYVDRPLPKRFQAGFELRVEDAEELRVLLSRRDTHLQRLYRDLQEMERQRDAAIAELHVGVLGQLRRAAGRILRGLGLPHAGESQRSDASVPALAQPAVGDDVVARASPPACAPQGESEYEQRIAQENAIFADQVDVHALPEIFHYWSNRYLLPMLQHFGVQHPEDFLAKYLFESAQRTSAARPRFVSLGSGNCDAEVRIAQNLVLRGLDNFVIECIDINPAMLERGRELAREAGLEGRVVPTQGDFNHWKPEGRYDGVMANQSLHHVLELESLFDAVSAALAPGALFVVSDMIGRNGHQRWPEALAIVREFWAELPESYRYNRQLQRDEAEFIDWDCSVEGFEGVRAQDILPLLLERFGFEVFLPFGNVIDPFIDRSFGHHFDPARDWDREFIDRVHARDEVELGAGRITPTHMMAVLRAEQGVACEYRDNLSPQHCLRRAS